MKNKLPVLMNITRKYIAIPPACKVLCNYTSEAAAKHRSFPQKAGGGIPLFDYKAPAENIEALSESKNVKTKQVYSESKVKSADINEVLSYEEVKTAILKSNKAVPLSNAVIKTANQQCLQEVNKQYPAVFQVLQKNQQDFHRGYRKNEYKKQGNVGVNCAWINNPGLSKISIYGCY